MRSKLLVIIKLLPGESSLPADTDGDINSCLESNKFLVSTLLLVSVNDDDLDSVVSEELQVEDS